MKKLEVTLETIETKELCTVSSTAIVTFCSMTEALWESYGACSSSSSCCN